MALQARLLERLLRGDGILVDFFPSNFPLPRWLQAVPGLRTLLRFALIWIRLYQAARKVSIIHVFAASWWYFFLTVWPAVLVGWLCRKRVILNYRGGEAARFFQAYGWFVAPVFRMAGVVTAPSNFLAEVITRRFAVPVAIVPNILDLTAFPYRERRRFEPKLLVTRHLEKMYDVESVLKAFRMVQAKYPEASLWIAGSGGEESRLRRLTAEWNLQNVRFLGHVAHADMPALCDQCDVLVNASLVDNFPGALLEASAAGLAVVSTGAGGIPFIYRNGQDAVLVEPGDWQSLGLAVQKVLEQPFLATNITRAAAALARSCEWKEIRKHLYAVYNFPLEKAGMGKVKCIAG